MKKKKKYGCGCTPQPEDCNVCNEPINQCKPINTCKKQVKQYVDCGCDDYEVTCVDKCADLAKRAEELFEKACKCESRAAEAFEQAQRLEKSSKVLSAKAQNLLCTAQNNENQARANECKAQELLDKARDLREQAKCLYKEGQQVQGQAQEDCEQAKCLYEQAQNLNDKARDLFNQAAKFDEKALQCYKTAGEKVKEYEMKSKVCEEMIGKCNNKLSKCEQKPITCEPKPVCIKPINKCKPVYDCSCNQPKQNVCQTTCNPCNQMPTTKFNQCSDEIIYVEDTDLCNNVCNSAPKAPKMCDSTYVSPMYDMCPMQYMNGFSQQYPTMDMPYMNAYVDQYQDMNDMWINYYNMVQGMMMQNMMPPTNY